MQHRKLDRLMTPVERIARVAAAGLTSATSSATKPSGAKSYDNADGTRTIIGNVANGESNPSYTMATHVGDVTAPGTPTGVTASSKSGVVVVEWDGTLTGGIPDDFFAVRVYLDGSELGILTGAGSVSSASLEGGTTHSVTATAEDDACLPDGTPAHNVSAATAAISVTVSEGVEGVAAIAQEALDVAEATGQHFWSDSDGIHVTEVTQEEWSDSTGPSYHSGQNVLINALGQLFRDGVNNLMALFNGSTVTETVTPTSSWYEVTLDSRPSSVTCTMNGTPLPSTDYKYPYGTDGVLAISNHSGDTIEVTYRVSAGMSLYDGQGNADGNITASFTDTLVRIGRSSVRAVVEFCGGMADLAYRGTSVILRSKTGSAGIQSGTKDLYSSTQAALMVSTLRNIYDGDTNIDLNTAKPRIFAIADSVYLLDTSDPYTLKKEVDMYSLIKATNCRSEGVVTLWAGTKVMTVNASSFTLFTKAQLQAIVGTSWTPTGSNCAVFVMNGDHGVSANMMSASIDASSVVRVHMNATRNGSLRVNYLIVRFA